MKKHVLSTVLGITAAALLVTGCNKPTQRPSELDKELAGKVMEIKELSEITGDSKAVFYSGSEKDLSGMNSEAVSLKQNKLEGKVEELTKKIKNPAKAAALAAQLQNGVIAIVVLEREIKILKVVPEINHAPDHLVSSLQLYNAMKDMSKTSDAQAQSELAQKMDVLKFQSPAQLHEKFGLVEISSIKVEKYGVLEDQRTEYGERKSVQGITQKPFQFATHIVVGDEMSAEPEGGAGGEEAAAPNAQ